MAAGSRRWVPRRLRLCGYGAGEVCWIGLAGPELARVILGALHRQQRGGARARAGRVAAHGHPGLGGQRRSAAWGAGCISRSTASSSLAPTRSASSSYSPSIGCSGLCGLGLVHIVGSILGYTLGITAHSPTRRALGAALWAEAAISITAQLLLARAGQVMSRLVEINAADGFEASYSPGHAWLDPTLRSGSSNPRSGQGSYGHRSLEPIALPASLCCARLGRSWHSSSRCGGSWAASAQCRAARAVCSWVRLLVSAQGFTVCGLFEQRQDLRCCGARAEQWCGWLGVSRHPRARSLRSPAQCHVPAQC